MARMDVIFGSPAILSALLLFVVFPLPNCPFELPPQLQTDPSRSRNKEWSSPAEVAIIGGSWTIFWQIFVFVVFPVASCPTLFAPQLQSEPESSKNKEWVYPLLAIFENDFQPLFSFVSRFGLFQRRK